MPPQKKKMAPQPKNESKHRKQKQPTQKPAMESVMVLGASGKLRMEKRPWEK